MSSRGWKIGAYVLAATLIAAAAAISATIGWRPFLGPLSRPVTGRQFERTPERLARGRYLAEAGFGCVDCHSPHDYSQPDMGIVPEKAYAGAPFFMVGLPGRVTAPNLTSDAETGLGKWSDDEIARAIREGVDRNGRALFPLMPYQHYRSMSDEDLASVVVFLRSLAPVHNVLPATEIDFPVKYLIRTVPQPVTAPVPEPDASNPVKRGEYLVTVSGCADCHTPVKGGAPIPGMDFSGGQILEGPWGRAASANITPDASGISYYDENLFIQTIRTGAVRTRKLNPVMPWGQMRNQTDDDLKAIFAYLRTLKPVAHRVDNTEAPTRCPVCGGVHGMGEKN